MMIAPPTRRHANVYGRVELHHSLFCTVRYEHKHNIFIIMAKFVHSLFILQRRY